MILQGFILCAAFACLLWRASMEKRDGALVGFSLIGAAVAISAFRRLVYTPGQFQGQMELDIVVCSVFFAGSVAVVVDDFHRRRQGGGAPRPPGGGDSWRRAAGPILLGACALLVSGTLMSAWPGEDFDLLTRAQVLEEMAGSSNPSAAMEQGRRFVVQFEGELRRLELEGSPSQQAWARATRINLARSRDR